MWEVWWKGAMEAWSLLTLPPEKVLTAPFMLVHSKETTSCLNYCSTSPGNVLHYLNFGVYNKGVLFGLQLKQK